MYMSMYILLYRMLKMVGGHIYQEPVRLFGDIPNKLKNTARKD